MERVLFLCTGNSCRSQMAEGFLRHMGGDNYEIFSAGTNPTEVNPLAIKVMQEVDIDISEQRSTPVEGFLDQEFDYVITVCDNARRECPLFPGNARKIHWDIEDPALAEGTDEEKLEVFREIRDRIEEDVLDFLDYQA